MRLRAVPSEAVLFVPEFRGNRAAYERDPNDPEVVKTWLVPLTEADLDREVLAVMRHREDATGAAEELLRVGRENFGRHVVRIENLTLTKADGTVAAIDSGRAYLEARDELPPATRSLYDEIAGALGKISTLTEDEEKN